MEIHTENIDVQNPSNTGAKIKDGNNKAEKKLAERIALTAHKEAEAVVYRDVEYFKMTHPEAEIEEAEEKYAIPAAFHAYTSYKRQRNLPRDIGILNLTVLTL